MANYPAIQVKGAKELIKKLDALPAKATQQMRVAMTNSLIDFERAMNDRLRGGTDALHVREGALRRSLHRTAIAGGTIGELRGTVAIGGAQAPYALAQEKGGTFRAKRSRFLAIPVGAALTAASRLRESMVGFLRNVPKVYFVKGNVFQRISKNKSVLIGVLKREVTLKPRLRFFDTWRRLASSRTMRLQTAIRKALGEKP